MAVSVICNACIKGIKSKEFELVSHSFDIFSHNKGVTVVSPQIQSVPCTSGPIFFFGASKYISRAPRINSRAPQNKIISTPYVLDHLHECPKIGLSTKINVFTSAPKWFSWLCLKIFDGISMNTYLDHFPERPKYATSILLKILLGYFHERPKLPRICKNYIWISFSR